MECNSKHQMIHGCNFCVLKVPCQCSISTPNFYLPPRLIACNSNLKKNVTKLHPVNLVLLQKFFDNTKFQQIFGDSLFSHPLNVTVPQFKIYNHEMSHVLANDVRHHLNLSKMVEIAKNDEIVFQTLAEPLAHGLISIPESWPDIDGILAVTAIAVTAISSSLVVWMFFKMRKLTAALLTLQQIHKTKALPSTLPSFVYTHRPTTESTQFDVFFSMSWEHANFIFLMFNTILLLLIILKFIKKTSITKSPRLVLEITCLDQCMFVSIMKLPLCPSRLNLNLPTAVTELRIIGSCVMPVLAIDWPDFSIVNTVTTQTMDIPSFVRISILQKYHLSKILKKQFYVQIHAEHGGYLFELSANDGE